MNDLTDIVKANTIDLLSEIPKQVTLVGVTKTIDLNRIKIGIDSGLKNIGENKVQEALDKYESLKEYDFKFHFLGPLQSNKVKKALPIFDLIHSVDRLKIAKAIDSEAKKINKVQDILFQINISEEENKSGFFLQEFNEKLNVLSKFENINVKGLMTIGPNVDSKSEIRNCFKKLKDLKESLNKNKIFKESLDILSMGMTNDYKIAIEEGSNMIRVGRAIFGERNY